MKIDIRNARVIDPATGRDESVPLFVADGRIASIGTAPDGFRPDRTIDAKGLVACPGLVDLSARLREPGFEYRATLESEMQAAVAGGVTSLACPPDTDPPLDEPGLVEMLKRRAESLRQARVYPLGALTLGLKGEKIAEMGELSEAGCVAFFQADAPLTDLNVLLQAMRYAATFGHAVWLRPAGLAPRPRRRRARRRGEHAPGPSAHSRGRGDRGAARHPGARRVHRRARAPGTGSPPRAGWPSWPRPRRADCP